MPMARPRQYVEAPAFTPLPYGLLTSLSDETLSPSDEHWRSGIVFEPICAAGDTTYDECAAVTGTPEGPGKPASLSPTTNIGLRAASPFTVYAEVDCSAVGFTDRARAVVSDALNQSEQWQVERAFWTGLAGGKAIVFPHLAADAEVVDSDNHGAVLQTAATVVNAGAPVDIVTGLGMLEAQMADCYDGVGVIHAPRNLLAPMTAYDLIEKHGDQYRTAGGNVVVFGGGYRGTSPAGVSDAGQTWMYGTGRVFIYRSDVTVREDLDRKSNTRKAIAERTYLLGWDCCHLGVNVSSGGATT